MRTRHQYTLCTLVLIAAVLCPCARAATSVPGCGTGLVRDGSFEAGDSSPEWTYVSTSGAAAICDASCLAVPVNDANNGDWWMRFPSSPVAIVTASIEQSLTLPVDNFGYLRFYLKAATGGTATLFRVLMDDNVIATYDAPLLGSYVNYVPLVADITPFLDGGSHTLGFDVLFSKVDGAFVHLDDVCIETQHGGVEGEGEGEACAEACATTGIDSDGDGLSDACEECAGSDPGGVDSDGDGMDDGFEIENGLKVNDPVDAGVDSDQDGQSNRQEYQDNTDPLDAANPFEVRFVSPAGVDVLAGGSSAAPWRTIAYAVLHTPASAEKPGVIQLAEGTYTEDVNLAPHLHLRAVSPLAAEIAGRVVGAEGAVLEGLSIVGAGTGPLLQIDNVAVRVLGCRFNPATPATGIVLTGSGSGASVIANCAFSLCDVAIDIRGAVPTLRANTIEHWSVAGLWVRASGKQTAPTGGVGSADNADTGFNQFVNGDGGPAVRNDRVEPLSCENTYWGTEDPETIAALVEGPVDFEPFLAASQILPAAIFCTLVSAEDQQRITDGTISIAPSAYADISVNTAGTYVLPALLAGTYTLTASAPGFSPTSQVLNLLDGDTATPIIALGLDAAPPQCGCNNAKGINPADAVIALSSILSVIVAAAWLRR